MPRIKAAGQAGAFINTLTPGMPRTSTTGPAGPRITAIRRDDPRATAIRRDEPRVTAIRRDEPWVTAIRQDEPRVAAIRQDEARVSTLPPAVPRLRLRLRLRLTIVGGECPRTRDRIGPAFRRLSLAQVLEPRVIGVVTEAARVRIVPDLLPGRLIHGLVRGLPAIPGGVRLVQVILAPWSPWFRYALCGCGCPLLTGSLRRRPLVRVTLLVRVLPPGGRPRRDIALVGPGFVIGDMGRRLVPRPSAAHEVSYP